MLLAHARIWLAQTLLKQKRTKQAQKQVQLFRSDWPHVEEDLHLAQQATAIESQLKIEN